MLNTNQKQLFWSGFLLIVFTLTANAILTNYLISQEREQRRSQMQGLTRATDHLFTALTYLDKEKREDFAKELKMTRKTLRSAPLTKLRQKQQ